MKTLKANTQRAAAFINAYNRSNETELCEVYGSYSAEKARAQYQCRKWFAEENGSNYRIIGHNCNTFTVAWKVAEGLRVETAYNSYLIVNA